VDDDGSGLYVGITIRKQLDKGPNYNKWFAMHSNGKMGFGQPSVDAGETCSDYSDTVLFTAPVYLNVGFSKTTETFVRAMYV
jgi:hypothetical protein